MDSQGEGLLNQLLLGGIALSVIAGLVFTVHTQFGVIVGAAGGLTLLTGAVGFAVKHGIIAARDD